MTGQVAGSGRAGQPVQAQQHGPPACGAHKVHTQQRLCGGQAYLMLAIFSCPHSIHCNSTQQHGAKTKTGWSATLCTLQRHPAV